jgi:beta-N-acetylhexosaminidase
MNNHSLGPLMISINGIELSAEEKEILDHPAVGGVILFTRNYYNIEQITKLNFDLKNLKSKNNKNNNSLLLAIDHEGGQVQRIKEPLTVLPAMADLGRYYESNSNAALELTKKIGWLLAAELLTLGFDFSFTPVLDLNLCDNKIIKQRAFHKTANVVSKLALALRLGLSQAGMPAVAKHFPGHGAVIEDSHYTLPIDQRSYKELDHLDLEPYRELIANKLEAIMTSHIVYKNIDSNVATFSKFWLQNILRGQLNFPGLIISDDLNMAGAKINSTVGAVKLALAAGCELLLLCNNTPSVVEVLDDWSHINWQGNLAYCNKLNNMRAKPKNVFSLTELKKQQQWQNAVGSLEQFVNNLVCD